MEMDEDGEIDVDDLFDNELEASSQGAEGLFDEHWQASDYAGVVEDEGTAGEDQQTTALSNDWEQIRNKEMLKSVWEKSKKQTGGGPSQKDSAGGVVDPDSKGRTPRPRLTERELTGERGLSALCGSFVDFEVNTTLGPYANMSRLLDRMENWAHCLYPPLAFDDFLEKVEVLGKKRLTRYALNNIRLGVGVGENAEQKGGKRLNDENCCVWDDENDDGQSGKDKHHGGEFIDDFYDDDYCPSPPKDKANKAYPVAAAQQPAISTEGDGEDANEEDRVNPLFTPMNSDDEEGEVASRKRKQAAAAEGQGFSFIPAGVTNRPTAYSAHPRKRAVISDDEESFDESELIADIDPDDEV